MLFRSIIYPTAEAMNAEEREKREKEVPEIQLQLRSGSRLLEFRDLGVRACPRSSPSAAS